jgi:glutamate dehydrogenase (NAD(P)+)
MDSIKRDSSFLDGINHSVDRAVELLGIEPGLAAQIEACNASYTVRFPVRMRGSYRTFTGWRAVHSEHRLPVKGGRDLLHPALAAASLPHSTFSSPSWGE